MDTLSLSQDPELLRQELSLVNTITNINLNYGLGKIKSRISNPQGYAIPEASQIISASMQREIGQRLERFFIKNGGRYKNPSAIARWLISGEAAIMIEANHFKMLVKDLGIDSKSLHKKQKAAAAKRNEKGISSGSVKTRETEGKEREKGKLASDSKESLELRSLRESIGGLRIIHEPRKDCAHTMLLDTYSDPKVDGVDFDSLEFIAALRRSRSHFGILHTTNYGPYAYYVKPCISKSPFCGVTFHIHNSRH